MRLMSTGITALALTAFAIIPASACPWGKTAEATQDMTVADTTVVPRVESDVSIATNDLSDEALRDVILQPEAAEEPTE